MDTQIMLKKCDSISLSYGTRDSIWVPPNVAGLYMMCEKTEYKHCSVKGKFTTLGLTKSDYVDLLDPYFWMIK